MLVFITTVRHPRNCVSYDRMQAVLSACLRSVSRQRDAAFRSVVVCNQRPDFPEPPGTDFVTVSFPPPSTHRATAVEWQAMRRDKGTKTAVGLLHCAQYRPSHVMLHDCDDLLSNRLAGFVKARPQAAGWHCARGWAYTLGRRLLRPLENFHKLNGSAHILAADLLELPAELHPGVAQETLLRRLDRFFLLGILGAHLVRSEYCAMLGRPLAALPFPSTVYIRGTGEHQCAKPPMRGSVAIDAGLAEEFSLARPDPDPLADAGERLELVWDSASRLGRGFVRRLLGRR